MFDGMFFDRDPEEYFNPTPHERMGKNGRENIIFRGKSLFKTVLCICSMGSSNHYINWY